MGLSQQIGSSSLSKPGVCTSTTRPATPYEGQMIYETDTDKVLVWNGSAWKQVPTAATAGAVLQVVQSTYSTQITHNSSTYTTSNLAASITPLYSSSTILVQAFVNGTVKGAEAAGNALFLELRRGSTAIEEVQNLHLTNTVLLVVGTCYIQILDTPATTSSTTYTIFGKNAVNGSTVATQFNNVKSTITLQEISA